MRQAPRILLVSCLLAAGVAGRATAWPCPAAAGDEKPAKADDPESRHPSAHHSSRLSDEYIPLQLEGFPKRPKLLLELGNPYLGTGNIKPGFELPTGAVWQPTLILFGTLRTAVQSFEAGGARFSEVAARLDLFANLQLSGTERLVVGFRNLDREGRFTSYVIEPEPADGDRFREELNADIQSLYFEGDFGEIFPKLDKEDFGRKDYGFAIGRQPLLFQEGMLIDDSIDGIGITRNTLLPRNTSNFRATLYLGFENVHRSNFEDDEADLFALLTSTDFRASTVDADLAVVTGSDRHGDQANLGVSAVQRLGKYNTSFRVLASSALDEETFFSTDGVLLFSEVSWTPHYTHDLVYVTTFAALDRYSSAARGPATGGPLGRAGINFAAVGLGRFGAPLSSVAWDVAGGAVGYQKFLGPENRRQVLAELGVRLGLADSVADSAAVSVRYQTAVGRRLVFGVSGFGARIESTSGASTDDRYGGRFEVTLKF